MPYTDSDGLGPPVHLRRLIRHLLTDNYSQNVALFLSSLVTEIISSILHQYFKEK